MKTNTNKATTKFVLLSLFAAFIFVLAFTPIGYIQLGLIKATIIHVPVIMGAILLGPKCGAVLGAVFGLTSLISNTIAPVLLSFAFSPFIPLPGASGGSLLSLLTCFVPRILVGVVPYYVYRGLNSLFRGKALVASLAVAGVSGALTNTLLVMNGIFLLFRDAYASARGIAVDTVYKAILAVIAGNGIPEAIVAGVLAALVCRTLLQSKQVRAMVAPKTHKAL